MKDLRFGSTYISEQDFSLKGFMKFCKENIILIVSTLLVFLAVYGVNLTNITIGVDTEAHINHSFITWMIQIGRFGYSALEFILYKFSNGFNLFLVEFLGCLFLYVGTILWCFLLYIFSNGKIGKLTLILFSSIFISNQVWAEQLYFRMQCSESMLIVLILPITIFLLYDSLLSWNIKKYIASIIMAIFCTSIYQSAVILFVCGIFGCFLLFKENTAFREKDYCIFCITLLISIIIVVIFYFLLNKIVLGVSKINPSKYLTEQVIHSDRFPVFVTLVVNIYKDTVGNFAPIQKIAEPIMAKYAKGGWDSVYAIRELSKNANIFIIPAVILFFTLIFKNKKRSILYILSAICIPLCTLALPILSGGIYVTIRSQYSVPFATAFVILYILRNLNTRNIKIFVCTVVALLTLKQICRTSMLNYSEVRRYNYDVQMSQNIAQKISDLAMPRNTPVILYGVSNPSKIFKINFIQGEVLGHSSFDWVHPDDIMESTGRGLAFMRAHGYDFYSTQDIALINKARKLARTMPDFPARGSVQDAGGIIVIRLSETLYEEKDNVSDN